MRISLLVQTRFLMLMLAAIASMTSLSSTATAAAAAKEPAPKRLPLREVDGLTNGRIAYVAGKTGDVEQRFYASNLFVTQPVLITLKADNPGDELQLKVTKTQWSKAERNASTGDRQKVQVAFRTQGEFGIAISGAKGTPYRMTVWIGDEVKRPMPNVIVPKSGWGAGKAAPASATVDPPESRAAPEPRAAPPPEDPSGSSGSFGIWLIAGLLAVIAGLLFALLRKNRER